jgi:hypothetical protein
MNMQSFLDIDLFLQVSGITPGRAAAIVPAVLGLIGVIIGRRALTRSAHSTQSGRVMGTVALVLGLIGVVLSVLHLARTTGGFGTGSGRLGAIVAIVLGLISVMLGGLALVRSRRIARRTNTGS